MNKIKQTIPFLFLFGCVESQNDSLNHTRVGEFVCPPECTCVCEDPGSSSSTTSSSSSSSSAATDTDASSSSSSSSSGTTPPTTLAEAAAQMGGVLDPCPAGTTCRDDQTWVVLASGRRFRLRWRFWDPDAPTPIRPVFAFHASSNQKANNAQWDSYRHPNNGGFLVVLPDATNTMWHTDPSDPTDFPFAQDVIEAVESWPFVDATNRYLTGWSAGTFMSNSVACHLGVDVLVAGSGGVEYLNSTGEPASCLDGAEVFLHHGMNDTTVPVSMGHAARDLWAAELGCTAPTSSTYPLDWCGESNVSCSGAPGCVSYTCTAGALTWCEDASAHTQNQYGAAQRNVGELLFNPGT